MRTLIVLFNLHDHVDPSEYEQWAKTTDLPTVRNLHSVAGFEVYRSAGLLGADSPAPYQYVEVIDLEDLDRFGDDIAGDAMRRVAKEFQAFADRPIFMLADKFS